MILFQGAFLGWCTRLHSRTHIIMNLQNCPIPLISFLNVSFMYIDHRKIKKTALESHSSPWKSNDFFRGEMSRSCTQLYGAGDISDVSKIEIVAGFWVIVFQKEGFYWVLNHFKRLRRLHALFGDVSDVFWSSEMVINILKISIFKTSVLHHSERYSISDAEISILGRNSCFEFDQSRAVVGNWTLSVW